MNHGTFGACPCRPITGTRPRPWRPSIRDVRGKPSDRGSAGIIELNWLRRKTRCSHSGRLSGSSQSPILESRPASLRTQRCLGLPPATRGCGEDESCSRPRQRWDGCLAPELAMKSVRSLNASTPSRNPLYLIERDCRPIPFTQEEKRYSSKTRAYPIDATGFTAAEQLQQAWNSSSGKQLR